jgi:hypothetical protein
MRKNSKKLFDVLMKILKIFFPLQAQGLIHSRLFGINDDSALKVIFFGRIACCERSINEQGKCSILTTLKKYE